MFQNPFVSAKMETGRVPHPRVLPAGRLTPTAQTLGSAPTITLSQHLAEAVEAKLTFPQKGLSRDGVMG